ncbi:hypothetical protein Cgig2_011485 [Carnegiea gigantea]|uniref:Uncharacterized protein n=1 Tax=Carnegiea gigantea TaxID=171969 RepID=A0A9Q1KSF2_9CARY|nr:hypothetical protein Cgig2_011485 [Carnegiea gigantea]
MEKEVVKHHHSHGHQPHNTSTTTNSISSSTASLRERQIVGEGLIKPAHSPDFDLRWGSRKRLRCMKTPTFRVDRRVVRSDNNNGNSNDVNGSNHHQHATNGHFNLRQRAASPAQPLHQRVLSFNFVMVADGEFLFVVDYYNLVTLRKSGVFQGVCLGKSPLLASLALCAAIQPRNSENGSAMKGQGNRGLASPEKVGVHHEMNGGRTTSSERGGGASSGGGGSDVVVWPPRFMIALTNKEKEEDFMAIKGSKLPQRPKKRAKFIQRTLNLVSPGGWLCDLTLERYEVREKKTSKKRPRGLKAMGNYMDSDSE